MSNSNPRTQELGWVDGGQMRGAEFVVECAVGLILVQIMWWQPKLQTDVGSPVNRVVGQIICATTLWKPTHCLASLQALPATWKCDHRGRNFIHLIVDTIGLGIVECQQHVRTHRPGPGLEPCWVRDTARHPRQTCSQGGAQGQNPCYTGSVPRVRRIHYI